MDEQSDTPEPCGIWKQIWSACDAEILLELSESENVAFVDFSDFGQFGVVGICELIGKHAELEKLGV